MRKLFYPFFLLLFWSAANAQGKFGFEEVKKYESGPGLQPSPDGTYLAGANGHDIEIWGRTPAGYALTKKISGISAVDLSVPAISNDGNYIGCIDYNSRIVILRRTPAGTFKKIQVFTEYEREPNYLSFSADGKYLAASEGFSNDTVNYNIWEINGDEFRRVAHVGNPVAIEFSPTDPDLAYLEGRLYKFSNGRFFKFSSILDADQDTFHYQNPKQHAFSPLGDYFVGINDYRGAPLFVWKRQPDKTFKLIAKNFQQKSIEATCIAVSPDSRYVVVFDKRPYDNKKRLVIYRIDGDSVYYEADFGQYSEEMSRFFFINNGSLAFAHFFGDILFYKVNGVAGNSFYKEKPDYIPSNTLTPTVTTTTVVKPVNTSPAANMVNIFWINPNPEALNDKPVVAEKSTIEIQVKVVSNKKVTQEDIKIIINGKEMEKNKFSEVSLKEASQENLFEYTYSNAIPLEVTPDNINTIEVIAAGKKPSKALKVLYSAAKPNLHVLAIGTSLDLQFPKKDAQDFANLFSTQGGSEKDKLFGNVDVRTLIGKDATTNAIKESIEKFRYDFKTGAIGPRDVMLIFISSHGFIYQDKFRIQGDDYRDIFKETYSVAYEEITSRLNEVPCKKLIFLDACFSGGAKASIADINNAIRDLNNQTQGVTTFSSSSNDEYSYEDEKWQNGAFTYSIKEALKDGKADKDKNGIITIGELYEYVSGRVPQIVTEVKSKSQHPTMPVNELKNLGVFVVGK